MKKKLSAFFEVIVIKQSYLNLLYLLLSFPLGIFYFVFLTTGLSLGIGLTITLFGIPLLFGVLLMCRVFTIFERNKAKVMLGIDIPHCLDEKERGFLEKIKFYLSDSFTWKSMAYLFIKFPLGVLSFVFLVTLISVSLSLIAVPIVYYLFEIGMIQGSFCYEPTTFCLFFNSYFWSIIIGIIGILFLFISLHILNGIAYVSGLLAKSLLKRDKF
jgi:hypothetical protein